MWNLIYIQPWGCSPDVQLLIEDMPFSAMRNGFRGVANSREMRVSETPGSG
ncbi:hypothetical protein CGCSCA1_v008726 [Colletotrichum siamense]|nr:hypothetical protein CGCSCA1_v008726 [Colletotrichum siamense]